MQNRSAMHTRGSVAGTVAHHHRPQPFSVTHTVHRKETKSHDKHHMSTNSNEKVAFPFAHSPTTRSSARQHVRTGLIFPILASILGHAHFHSSSTINGPHISVLADNLQFSGGTGPECRPCQRDADKNDSIVLYIHIHMHAVHRSSQSQ